MTEVAEAHDTAVKLPKSIIASVRRARATALSRVAVLNQKIEEFERLLVQYGEAVEETPAGEETPTGEAEPVVAQEQQPEEQQPEPDATPAQEPDAEPDPQPARRRRGRGEEAAATVQE